MITCIKILYNSCGDGTHIHIYRNDKWRSYKYTDRRALFLMNPINTPKTGWLYQPIKLSSSYVHALYRRDSAYCRIIQQI